MSLPSTKATSATGTHTVVQAVETYIQNQNLLGEIAELDELLYDLIDMHKNNYLALKRVVQCIYNLLQGNNKWNVKFGPKVFHKLISVIIADGKDDDSPHDLHRQLVANVLICVRIHVRKFPRIDSKFLLRQLWSLSLSSERQPHAAQILVQLFDDFVLELGEECACSSELYDLIQSLLQSDARDHRRSGYFLMRKLLILMQVETTEKGTNDFSNRVLHSLKCNEHSWFAFVVIMETLEEQQSHLVLPTLSTLLPRIAGGNQSDEWLTWVRILYVRLLQDNNILVLRWTLSYFITHFDVDKLRRVNLLCEFFAATNRTQLYNVEGFTLPELDMSKLMSSADQQVILKALVSVPWHSVPLHFWLYRLQPEKVGECTGKYLLLELSSRVRTLRNTKLRQEAILRVFELFKPTINSLTLGDFMIFIETLFNVSDKHIVELEILITKMRNCENANEDFVHFNRHCYEIFVRESGMDTLIEELMRILNKLPSNEHGWWRLFPLFLSHGLNPSLKETCLKFYSDQYNVNTDLFERAANLNELQQHLLKKLKCETKDEKSFVLERCVDWFVSVNIVSWNQLEELNLSPDELLDRGTKTTFEYLTKLLRNTQNPIKDEETVLKILITHLKKHQHSRNITKNIAKYAAKHLNETELNELLSVLDKNDKVVFLAEFTNNTLTNLIVNGLIDGEISSGDARIEAAYIDSKTNVQNSDVSLRNEYVLLSLTQEKENINTITEELLRINNELTSKKPRYFENCREHRIKIRISRALLMMCDQITWSHNMWTAALAPCDQLNISYMYECLVAKLLPSVQSLLEQMQTLASLKPSQQVSIISVAHLYCRHNWLMLDSPDLEKVVNLLLPHTMGAHYQTRLLAQLVLHSFALQCETDSTDVPILKTLRTSIESTLGDKLDELCNEPRLLLPEIISQSVWVDLIPHMTNTPFDEYDKPLLSVNELKMKIEAARAFCKAKKAPLTNIPELPMDTSNFNVQRKMNPVNDIYTDNDLAKTEGHALERELIVVASLIDKLPNLGGLARTCEVLGVKTLILGAKSQSEKADFTNLSMTAEKTLNIIEVKPNALGEFLIDKQSMGYKIVGAEQTAHSVSFVDFKFPEKCILLLGHEKHGIPVDLIALMDFAVEIPQFGMVRSLNVHVTGSLFIWEYCRQHLIK